MVSWLVFPFSLSQKSVSQALESSSRNFTNYQSRATLRILYKYRGGGGGGVKSFPISRDEGGISSLEIHYLEEMKGGLDLRAL